LFFVNNNLRSIHNYSILFANGKLPRRREVKESSEEVGFNEGQSDPSKRKIIRKKHDTELKHTNKNESPSEQNVDDKSKHLEDQHESPHIEFSKSAFQKWSPCKRSFMKKTMDRFNNEIDELISKKKAESNNLEVKHRKEVNSLTSKQEMEDGKSNLEQNMEFNKLLLKRDMEWDIIITQYRMESNELSQRHRTEFSEFLQKHNLRPGQLRLKPNREHAELMLKQQNEEDELTLKQRKRADEYGLKRSTEYDKWKSNQHMESNNLESKYRVALTKLKFKHVEEYNELSNEIPDEVLNESFIDPKYLEKLNLSKKGNDVNDDEDPDDISDI
jgi:hypothetical protein